MKISKCRVCEHRELVPVGSLGNIALSNFTLTKQQSKKYPLELVFCQHCSLLQLSYNTPRNLLYKNYWYQSHLNPVIVQNLKEIARECKGVHIDIGANDGTLLKFSQAETKIAVDPSNIIPDGFTRIQDYWENVSTQPADTITAIACLYDLPNPNKFIKNIKQHLKPDGVFIAQLMTLQPFIENNDIGNICHEHLLYFSYESLVRLYEQNGLEVFRIEMNSLNGGSYRVFARHLRHGSIRFAEKTYTIANLKKFFTRLETNKRQMVEFMKYHSVVGYGASTKMGTIVQYYGVTPNVVVDINPSKVGKSTVAGALVVDRIPNNTKYLWVFPYGFIDYFQQKESNYHGKWITSIPQFKII